MAVTGQVDLAGQLNLIMLGTGNFIIGDSDYILSYGSLIGGFESVEGLFLGGGKHLLLSYGADRLTVTVHLAGDLNGDGFVGIEDLNVVLSSWNQYVTAGLGTNGDATGDGFVGIEDLNVVLGNWNAGTPPGMIADTITGLGYGLTKEKVLTRFSGDSRAIPEPGTVGLLGLGLGALLGRRRRSDRGAGYHSVDGRSLTMRGTKHIAAAVLGAALLGSSPADAAISFDLLPVDNSAALTGYTTYDMQVTTDTDWTAAAMLLELSAGSIYQHEYGADSGPPNGFFMSLYPELAFDTYVIGNNAGGGGDVGGDGYAFGTGELDVSWYNLTPGEVGTTTIGRLTVTDDATGNLTLMLTTESNEVAQFMVGIDAGVAQASAPVVEETSLLSGVSLESELRYVNPWASPLGSSYVDTRDSTPVGFWKDKSLLDDWPRPRPTKESFSSTSSEITTPEPGSLALIGACLGLIALRRR